MANLKLRTEPAGTIYEALLDAAQSTCDTAILVVRPPPLKLSENGHRVLEQLAEFLVTDNTAQQWPGTRLLRGTARVLTYRLVPDSCHALASATNRLFGWCQPELPEDLALVRKDSQPWLFSVSHEKDAYLMLTIEERKALSRSFPIVGRFLENPDGLFS